MGDGVNDRNASGRSQNLPASFPVVYREFPRVSPQIVNCLLDWRHAISMHSVESKFGTEQKGTLRLQLASEDDYQRARNKLCTKVDNNADDVVMHC
jgi:hypothetical protein